MSNTQPLAHTRLDSPLGALHIVADAQGLVGIWFHDQKHLPRPAEQARWVDEPAQAVLQACAKQLTEYFQGDRKTFDLPLSPEPGTVFQRLVWQALQRIPFGQTLSYGNLAQALGRPQAVRAVGTAVGRNPWSVVVPCHRVLGAQGALTGYAGGLHRKSALLQLEQANGLPT